MQDELQSMADLLSSLRTGEAIISGEGVKMISVESSNVESVGSYLHRNIKNNYPYERIE